MEEELATGIPTNMYSKRPYRGINYLSLSMCNYASPQYITFKQCKDLGGNIKPGEKGNIIIFWKIIEIPQANESQTKKVPYLRYTHAFNITQTTLHHADEVIPPADHSSIISRITTDVAINHNTMNCFYSPAEDAIYLPSINKFDTEDEYYSALFHEAIHATGSANRLNRFSRNDKVTEELVAEIGAAFLCAKLGVTGEVRHAGYIKHWSKILKDDNKAIFKAAAEASKAVEFLMGSVDN